MLKPQDIVILLKILSTMTISDRSTETLSQNKLSALLCMSASEVNAGIKRLVLSGLLSPVLTDDSKNKVILLPSKSACENALLSLDLSLADQSPHKPEATKPPFCSCLFNRASKVATLYEQIEECLAPLCFSTNKKPSARAADYAEQELTSLEVPLNTDY